MEEELPAENSIREPKPAIEPIPEVYVLRGWKEYAGESLLIIFSVLLALILTEYINYLHDQKDTNELISNIRNEMITNRKHEAEQYAYQLKVLKSIDSALASPEMQKKIVANGEFHLNYIAPQGILYRYFDDAAWEVAKSHNIASKVDIKTIYMLTHIYADQEKVAKIEDEVAKVIFSPESRKPENVRTTLILIRDNYKGWAVDRAAGLLYQYDEAIKALDK
ncbi:hypothetical protein [Mucilaginibacter gotjawali]|uniref:Uncharacterized protein n=2 Tax=Mucilaginibacter gotjawali TaxID=1550579 RepID=A0A839SKB4_9SPHI|nr:hypothetical protein [Mucilaginibacter gotjawali]MBB3057902.1 hypothetical protein [Mucilaginibacter gotjawali]BAU52326.1 hypothetical protein MgSA37_00481 [Mucilaginibacter gotjawali]